MAYQVLYAAHPPQFSVTLSLEQLAARDARFADLRALRLRRALDLTVQDSADLQGAHLRLTHGSSVWQGTPGALDEDGSGLRRPFHGWSEAALEYGLGLDLAPCHQRPLSPDQLAAELAASPVGVLYAFARPKSGDRPALVRRLNLAGDLDRLEHEYLAATGYAGLDLLRLHRLGAGGEHLVLRAEVGAAHRAPAVEARPEHRQN